MDTPRQPALTAQDPSHPVGAGIGAAAGGVAGALVGGVAAGPIGMVAGAALGGSFGGAIGRDIAVDTQPSNMDLEASRPHYAQVEPLLRDRFRDRLYSKGQRFEDFEQAYLHGVSCHDRYGYVMWDEQTESDIRRGWESDPRSQTMPWDQARTVILDGWHAAEHFGGQSRE